MSTKITYNGKTTELADGYIATLPCKDFKMETDVVVEAPEPAEAPAVEEWDGTGVVIEEIATEDELAGTWVFNDTINMSGGMQYDVEFTYFSINDDRYFDCVALGNYMFYDDVVDFPDDYDTNKLYYFESGDGDALTSMNVYNGRWLFDTHRTINITSKLSQVTNGSTLLTWLKANATKQ